MGIDRRIDELPEGLSIFDDDLFVLEQSNVAKKLKGSKLKDYFATNLASAEAESVPASRGADVYYDEENRSLHFLIPSGVDGEDGTNGYDGEDGEDGNGVSSVALLSGDHSPGTFDLYRMTFTDGSHFDFSIWNGSNGLDGGGGETGEDGTSITDIQWTSGTHAPGTYDTYTIYRSDGLSFSFQIYNGLNGDGELPDVSQADNGKLLEVVDGTWQAVEYSPNQQMPSMTMPLMDGVAAVGQELKFARGDHKHPSDTSREAVTNKVTSISSSSTDNQYPSAKCMYDIIGDIESLLQALR